MKADSETILSEGVNVVDGSVLAFTRATENMALTKISPLLAPPEFLLEMFDINASNYKFSNISSPLHYLYKVEVYYTFLRFFC